MTKKRPVGRPRKYPDNAARCRAYRQRLKRSVHFRSDTDLWETPQTFESIKKLGVTPLGVFPPAVDPDTSAGTWSQAPDSGF
jgi:hypothetical protein